MMAMLAGAAAGFVGGLAAAALYSYRHRRRADVVDVPKEFVYQPQQPAPTLRVVRTVDPAAVDRIAGELAEAIRRHPAGKRIAP